LSEIAVSESRPAAARSLSARLRAPRPRAMAPVAPPRPAAERAPGPLSRANFLGFVDLSRAAHWLKLRQSIRASDRLRLELGLDCEPAAGAARPWAGLHLQLTADPASWALECNSDWTVLATPAVDCLGWTRGRAALKVDGKFGTDHYLGGAPHVEVGVQNPYVALALLAASLAARAPIHVRRREAGGLAFAAPLRFKGAGEVAMVSSAAPLSCQSKQKTS
jgi:hypothetical protein